MDFRRIWPALLVALIIYAVVKDPTGGGAAAHKLVGFFGEAAHAVDAFMRSL